MLNSETGKLNSETGKGREERGNWRKEKEKRGKRGKGEKEIEDER